MVTETDRKSRELALSIADRMVEKKASEHRYEMCRIVAEGDDRLEVSRSELDGDGISYMYETLVELFSDSDAEPVLIVGGDQAATFPDWHRPAEILDIAELAVTEREGFGRQEILNRLESVQKGAGAKFFEMPRIEVSSTMVRDRVKKGHPIRYLVPDGVVEYVRGNNLYGD